MARPSLPSSGPCFRHFRFDHRCQGTNALEVLRVEVPLHEFDSEMPFDLYHQLEDIDRIDFQFSAQKRLIVAQVLRGQVSDS
jgi:hypothetical protein